jgi:hypothetical protein
MIGFMGLFCVGMPEETFFLEKGFYSALCAEFTSKKRLRVGFRCLPAAI